MNILPIPKRLLTDSAVLLIPEGKDTFGDRYGEVKLENVRICFERKVRLSGHDTVPTSGGTLYFDCRNSSPINTRFDTKMKLKIGENRFRIAAAKPVKGESQIHHWEITFV